MPEVSSRGLALPPSPIRKLAPYADAAQARGVKVFHLNIGQPDLETPKIMRDRLQSIDPVIAYSPSAGTPTTTPCSALGPLSRRSASASV